MCTVTYLPSEQGYLLTSSRDEKLARSPRDITRLMSQHPLCFPQDVQAGGTWIALEQSGRSICVLNGGKQRHASLPPYTMSRGIMALHYFRFKDFKTFISSFNFDGIEPFSLVIIEELQLIHAWYDGRELYWEPLDSKLPHIWASVTLYSDEVIELRKLWFERWLAKNSTYSQEDIIHFHRYGGTPDLENGLIINRGEYIQTVSITSIASTLNSSTMRYWELNKDLKDDVYFNKRDFPSLMKATNA